MNNKSTFLIAASIIISALVNESFIIDSWTGDIYDIQGNNLTDIHKNISPKINNPFQTDKIQ